MVSPKRTTQPSRRSAFGVFVDQSTLPGKESATFRLLSLVQTLSPSAFSICTPPEIATYFCDCSSLFAQETVAMAPLPAPFG